MTMIDEQLIRDALSRTADGFEVPDDALERMLSKIHETAPQEFMSAEDAQGISDLPAKSATTPRAKRRKAIYKRKPVLLGGAAAAALLAAVALLATPTFLAAHRPETAQSAILMHAPNQAKTSGPNFTVSSAPGGYSMQSGAPNQAKTSGSSVPSALPKSVGRPAMIRQSGSIDLTVGKGRLTSVMAKLEGLAVGSGGFVASSQTTDIPGEAPSGSVTLQIPVADFTTVLKQVTTFGKVNTLTTSATDVTAQYVDLQARISALNVSLKQYTTIMTQASSIGDILSVQTQINAIQSQIEQLQGQLNVLGSETTYSALDVSVSETPPKPHHPPVIKPESGVVKAFNGAVGGFVHGFESVLSASGTILFVLLVIAVIIGILRFLWRGARRFMM